jgi:hypothetical protein
MANEKPKTAAPAAQAPAPTAPPTPAPIAAPAAKTPEQKAAEKAGKLMALAAPRVEKAIKSLAFVGNLGRYAPTADQVKAIDSAVRAAFDSCISQLNTGKAVPNFKLPSATAEQPQDEAKG